MFDTYARTHPEFDRMVSASSVAGDNKMTMVVVGQKRTATEEMSRLTVAEEEEPQVVARCRWRSACWRSGWR